MLPSDHFVRFYDEIFKFLERRGPEDVQKYYDKIVARQKFFCLEQFRRDGFKGMYDYWTRINAEENCDLRCTYDEHHFHGRMVACPSLAKAIDNDAGPCRVYCDHCPGWVLPLMKAAGFHGVYDLHGRTTPSCDFWAFKDQSCAQDKYDELVALRGDVDLVKKNF